MKTELLVSAGERRKRLDLFLVGHERGVSRARIQRLIGLGRIKVNGHPAKPAMRVQGGDQITFDLPLPAPLAVQGAQQPLKIIHEDEILLVIDKPPGVVMHPGSGHWSGTLVNAVLDHFEQSDISGRRPGIVHRLDKDTSGLVLVAKTQAAHRALSSQFERHSIIRFYIAMVAGDGVPSRGLIDVSLGRDRRHRPSESGGTFQRKPATTGFEVVERYGGQAACLQLRPRTGRTHQLRIHLQSIGAPILGDVVYGGPTVGSIGRISVPRVMLHACTLGYQHPSTGTYQEFHAPLPPDMEGLRQLLLGGRTDSGAALQHPARAEGDRAITLLGSGPKAGNPGQGCTCRDGVLECRGFTVGARR